MALNVPQRIHAWINGFSYGRERSETQVIYSRVEKQFAALDLLFDDGRARLVELLCKDVLESFGLPPDHSQSQHTTSLIGNFLIHEQLFELPDIHPKRSYTTAQHWDHRKALKRQLDLVQDMDETYNNLRLLFCHILDPVFEACPRLLLDNPQEGITVETDLSGAVGNLGLVIEKMARACCADDVQALGLAQGTAARLEYNLILASGGNPSDPKAFMRAAKHAGSSDITNPKELIHTYLGGTALRDFFNQSANFCIPTETRFEHHHLIAGSGHGKTQTLQYMILKDLEAVAQGNRSVVVIDSQGDLIRTISGMSVFAEGGPLHDRIVIIDPTDVEWPVSLNLFDVGQDRLSGYSPLDRERLTNSILELYDFVLGSLLDAGMTQKQNVIFRYVTRLLLHIPNATIHTLRELMEDGSEVKFAPHFSKLSGSARHFFETEFSSKEFAATKRQVLRRLWGILENQTFERMFSHPKSKLDLYSEMNAGRVILINTAKDLLKETGTEIFGRFFIALIAQAAQERATQKKSDRMPTMVYIDEASDYFDRNIGIILSQARKYKIGMVLAHQYLGQLEPRLQEAFGANTSIKMAGGVSSKDARVLAPQMHTNALEIEQQNKGSFITHLRGVTSTAIPLRFPFGVMEKMPRMLPSQRHALQEVMRERYSVHYSDLGGILADVEDPSPSNVCDPTEPPEPTKGW